MSSGVSAGRSSRIPYFEVLGLVEASGHEGTAVAEMKTDERLGAASELGIQAAVAGLADVVLSFAAVSVNPGSLGVTLGLHIDFMGELPEAGTRLVGNAEVESRLGSMTLVHGRVLEGDEVIASASLHSMAIDPTPTGGAGSASAAKTPAEAPPLPARTDVPLSPDVSRVFELARDLVGATDLDVDPSGAVALHLVPPAHLERTIGAAHGGAVANIAQLAAAAAAQAALPEGTRPRRLSTSIDYLRPTMIGEPLVALAEVAHRGRRALVVNVGLRTADGRLTGLVTERSILDDA